MLLDSEKDSVGWILRSSINFTNAKTWRPSSRLSYRIPIVRTSTLAKMDFAKVGKPQENVKGQHVSKIQLYKYGISALKH